MKLCNIIAGLQLLQPHYTKNLFPMNAEHDQVYLEATDTPLTELEVARMQELGWFQPETEDDEGEPGPYDIEEAWSFFT